MRGAPADSNIVGGMPPSSTLSVAMANQVGWLKESDYFSLPQENVEILNLDMKHGNILKVKGKISADTVGFSINLGYSSRDLALHFNPRFNESVIVCNSKCSDSWQTEHRDHHLSFFRGCTVKFFIEMLSDKFRVKLPDGYEVCFPNRHGYRKINYISIMGGLKVISFKLS